MNELSVTIDVELTVEQINQEDIFSNFGRVVDILVQNGIVLFVRHHSRIEEGQQAGEHLIEYDAGGPNVNLWARVSVNIRVKHFRRVVERCAVIAANEVIIIKDVQSLTNAEIGQFEDVLVWHEHIIWLDVPVNDTTWMQVVQTIADLPKVATFWKMTVLKIITANIKWNLLFTLALWKLFVSFNKLR